MTDKKLYYFAHPYSVVVGGKRILAAEEANFRLCCFRTAELLKRGYLLYAPVCATHPIHSVWPESLADGVFDWYGLDNAIIAACDFWGIILAPGWRKSRGCIAERDLFLAKNKPVYFYEDLVETPQCPK